MNVLEIIDEANEKLNQATMDMDYARAEHIGLDSRAGRMYIDTDNSLIVVENQYLRSLDYYGGFEYIKEGDGRTTLGHYTVFNEHDRVQDALDAYRDHCTSEIA